MCQLKDRCILISFLVFFLQILTGGGGMPNDPVRYFDSCESLFFSAPNF